MEFAVVAVVLVGLIVLVIWRGQPAGEPPRVARTRHRALPERSTTC